MLLAIYKLCYTRYCNMLKIKILCPSLCVLAMAISGCTEVVVKEKEDLSVSQSIITSANEIHRDLLQLNKLKELNPHPFQPRSTPTVGPLSKKMTLKWIGTPEEAVKTISTLISFAPPRTIGKQPANGQAVMINAVDKPASEILEDIGMQMGSKAGLSIGKNQISIIYEGAHE